MQWSPLGTYLATVHRQGAAVWGGATTFNRLMRYKHDQVIFTFYVHYCNVSVVGFSFGVHYCNVSTVDFSFDDVNFRSN